VIIILKVTVVGHEEPIGNPQNVSMVRCSAPQRMQTTTGRLTEEQDLFSAELWTSGSSRDSMALCVFAFCLFAVQLASAGVPQPFGGVVKQEAKRSQAPFMQKGGAAAAAAGGGGGYHDQPGAAAAAAGGLPTHFHPIASLHPYHSKWTIKARVTAKGDKRTWSNAKGEGSLFSVDLLDAQGGQIKATMFSQWHSLTVGHVDRARVVACSVV
jgi:hypothetical protein